MRSPELTSRASADLRTVHNLALTLWFSRLVIASGGKLSSRLLGLFRRGANRVEKVKTTIRTLLTQE